MRAIFGIGNPGTKYEKTRHNIGFIILEEVAKKYKLSFQFSNKNYYIAESRLGTFRFLLIKPLTYVNLSGIAAKEIIEKYNIEVENFLVITDDLNLKESKIKVKKNGGAGGHNGISSIIYHIESDEFPRLKFGIGDNFHKGNMADFVLSKYNKETIKQLEPSIKFSVNLIEEFVAGGTKKMLDYYSKYSSSFSNKLSGDKENV